jgi:SHS2 domain-containing protein
MPRRKKAQLYDLINRIIYLHEKEGKGFREIEAILKAEGYDISKSAIHRAYKSYAESAEEFKKVYEETKAFIETLKENPATDVMEGIATILANRLFKFVKDIESIDFETPEELILSVQRLAKTLSDLQKVREEREKKAMEILQQGVEEGKVDEEIIEKIKAIYGA